MLLFQNKCYDQGQVSTYCGAPKKTVKIKLLYFFCFDCLKNQ